MTNIGIYGKLKARGFNMKDWLLFTGLAMMITSIIMIVVALVG